jgi:hypothetical protein
MEIAPPPGMPALVTSNLLILVATNVLFPFNDGSRFRDWCTRIHVFAFSPNTQGKYRMR